MKSSKFLLLLLFQLVSCCSGSVFSSQTKFVQANTTYYGFASLINKSDFKWAFTETTIKDYSFDDYRKIMNSSEESLRVVSREDFMCFVQGKQKVDLSIDESVISSATIVNLSQVCYPTDSFGYFYGLPVSPLFSFEYCDWNRYLNSGYEPSYISTDFADRLIETYPDCSSYQSLLGKTFIVCDGDSKIKHTVNNIFSFESSAGKALKSKYGDIIVSSNKTIFCNQKLCLNISFMNDFIACHDFCKIISNTSNVESVDVSVCFNGVWESTDYSSRVSALCFQERTTNVVLFSVFLPIFLLSELFTFFLMLNIFKNKLFFYLFLFLPKTLYLLATTCINAFFLNSVYLDFFNPLFAFISLCLIIAYLFFILKRRKNETV